MKFIYKSKVFIAAITLFALLLLLSLNTCIQLGGGFYTVGQVDGQIHDQVSNIAGSLVEESHVQIDHIKMDSNNGLNIATGMFLLSGIFYMGSRFFFLLTTCISWKQQFKFILKKSLVLLCIRMDN